MAKLINKCRSLGLYNSNVESICFDVLKSHWLVNGHAQIKEGVPKFPINFGN